MPAKKNILKPKESYLVARQGPETSSASGMTIGPFDMVFRPFSLMVTVMTLMPTSEVFGGFCYSFENTF